jgi:two-component sensor histidine kinase
MTGKPGGIRAAIVLLLLIPVLVPLFAALVIWLGERESGIAANDRVQSAARVASADVRLLVESSLERLRQYDEQLGPDPSQFTPRPGSFGEAFTVLYDAKGEMIVRGGARETGIADNPAFKAIASGKQWVITPMLGAANSLRFFGIGRRIERDGRFAGAVALYVSADVLADTWNDVGLGTESTVSMIRDDGWLVAHYPLPPKAIDLSSGQLFANVKTAPQGVFVSLSSPVDGVPRRVAYQTIAGLGLIVVASISRTSATEALWSRVGSTAIVAGPLFLALLFLCGWAILLLVWHEKNRVALEQALAQNRMLFQEIHHRVKNNLQQVASLIRLQLSPDQALPLGMIVNEVVSNAFKHGFPNGRAGEVNVTLTRPLEGNDAVLTIADNGAGMGEIPAGGIGLGTRLINGLAAQLQGSVSMKRGDGVTFDLKFPVELARVEGG